MAGSIRGSDIAEPAAAMTRPSREGRERARRWTVLRQAARTRLGPLGVVAVIVAVTVALLVPPFPPLVLALALGAVLGAGLTGVVIALGVVYTPTFARLMRGQVLAITARDYVEAARALGAPGWRVAWHHVLPNAAAPIVIQASLSVAFAILAEASLSFLGLGIQPPGASWGSMINAGRGYLQQAPWIVFWPGTALFVTVVGLNFVGDTVREALDPRLRK